MPAHSHSMRQRSSAHKRHVFFLVCFFLLLLAVGLFFLIKALFFTTPPWERKASFPSTATSSNPLSAKNPGIHLYSLDAMLRGDTVFQNTDSLILVNHVYTLSQEPSSLVYEESGEFAMTEDTLEAYLLMKEQADANSAEPLGIISSYRTAEEQTYLYETNPYAAPVWEVSIKRVWLWICVLPITRENIFWNPR